MNTIEAKTETLLKPYSEQERKAVLALHATMTSDQPDWALEKSIEMFFEYTKTRNKSEA